MKKFYDKYRKKWWFWFIIVGVGTTIISEICLLFYNPKPNFDYNRQQAVKYSVPNGSVIDYKSYTSDERGEYYGLDGTDVFEIVIRVSPRSTAKETVDQNYENAYDLITNQGLSDYHTFKYKAIAINENDEEYTLMSFNIYAPWIKKISETKKYWERSKIKAYCTDVYIDSNIKLFLE